MAPCIGAGTVDAGWSSPVARQAHNLKVIGSNPIPATKLGPLDQSVTSGLTGFFMCAEALPTATKGLRAIPMG